VASNLRQYEPKIYAVMRIVVGFLFFWHGTSKLFGFPTSAPDAPAMVIYVAGGLEFVGGALLMAGFQTRLVAFLCSGLMAAAYFMAHQANGILPIQNHGELAALYCFVFLFISAHGSGIWSVDGSD
jgi:putative oxidoreductase